METTILVIDDDDLFVRTVRFVLEKHGYHVLTANSGVEGVEMARTHLPDLILCDIHMRNGHGYTTVLALRRHPESEGIPIVMVTGKGNPFVEKKSRLHGADYYLGKPFSVSKLIDTVEVALKIKPDGYVRSKDVIFYPPASGSE